jgi:hypothetical protein
MRHRLKKKDPNAAVSEAVKPIIYYSIMEHQNLYAVHYWKEQLVEPGF